MPSPFTTGSAREAVIAHGGALYLFKNKERNDIVRLACTEAGKMWQAKFLPLRFTSYVVRSPFNYGTKRLAFYIKRLRYSDNPEIRKAWNSLITGQLMGWSPYSPMAAPQPLYSQWIKQHQGMYKINGPNGDAEAERAYHDIRSWAMSLVAQLAIAISVGAQPLVDTGDLRASSGTGNVVCRSTAFIFKLWVTVPFPNARNVYNQKVQRIIETVPPWEHERVGTMVSETIASIISGSQDTFTARAGSVTRMPTILGAQSRIPESAIGRSID